MTAQRLLFRGEPFTGEVAEYHGGSLTSLNEFSDGVLHGRCREWYRDGTPRSEGMARNGRAVGECREWHPDGVVKCRRFVDGSVASLREEQTWDERGDALGLWRREDT
ncbi:toxin-antitoxin system YwqK family antitoxin [Streptomyces sp. Ac-502]|uniref:toxin-antitoxin system YwqK family antitoxin n=1 Tax=Streptomyces sp. Ac-502 TaxID=3342801 RepID=UPI0038628848